MSGSREKHLRMRMIAVGVYRWLHDWISTKWSRVDSLGDAPEDDHYNSKCEWVIRWASYQVFVGSILQKIHLRMRTLTARAWGFIC